jgi:hypothetical protein
LVLKADPPVKRLIPLVALAACIDTDLPPIDLDGPMLVSIEPATAQPLPLDPSIRLVFSEPLARPTIEPALGGQSGTVLLMTRYKLDGDGRPELDDSGQPESNLSSSMITDLNAGDDGLDAASYFARCVQTRVTLLDDDQTVLVQPMQRLRANTEYMIVLSSVIRDAAGNRLGSPPTPEQEAGDGLPHVLRVYQSAAGPPSVIGADLPGFTTELPTGPVPTNRSTARLEFDRSMASVSSGDVKLVLGENLASVTLPATLNGKILSVTLPTLGADANHSGRCLEGDDADNLCPSSDYALIVENMRDNEGNVMEQNRLSFSTAAAADTQAPVLIGEPEIVAGETDVLIRWKTDEASSTEVVVMGESDQSFYGVACVGNPCDHEVRLTDLSIGQQLTFFLRSKDLALNAFESEDLQVTTIDLPDVAITEVLAASGRDPDNSGEYIELFNFGQEAIEIGGWQVQRIGSTSRIDIPEETTIAAGGFVLLVGDGFAVGNFSGVTEGNVLRTTSSKLFSFGLSNSDLTVALVDDQGRSLSATPRLVSSTGMSKARERLDAEVFCNATPTPLAWTANNCQ